LPIRSENSRETTIYSYYIYLYNYETNTTLPKVRHSSYGRESNQRVKRTPDEDDTLEIFAKENDVPDTPFNLKLSGGIG